MISDAIAVSVEAFMPTVMSVAACAARLLPCTLLCPLLGGQTAPMTVRLALVLVLSLFAHFCGGIGLPSGVVSAWAVGAVIGRELLFGTAIGLVAGLPFDAARMGGRFVDLFRGSSAEAALPVAGSRDSATADGMYHLLISLAVTAGALPLVLAAFFKSFTLVPIGTAVMSETVALQLVGLAGVALATGLAIGAPIAGVSLCVDALIGFVSRAAPGMNLQDQGAPLRILCGGAVLWLSLGLFAERLLAGVAESEWALHALFGAAA